MEEKTPTSESIDTPRSTQPIHTQSLNLPHFWDDKQHIRDIPKLSKAYIESLPYRSGLFTSRIVVVGEAPGREEELTKVPFVGASGKLLRRYIHNAYITNVLKVRPENNDFAKFLKENPDEVRNHVLTLAAELRYTNANVYVAVGETALNVLCGKSGITKWHGSILEATMPTIKGRKVIPLIHPAAVLRNWKDYFPLFFIDCQRILSDSEFPELRIPERKYIIRPSLNQVVEFLAGLIEDNSDDESEKVIAFDLETRNHLIASIQFCNNPYEAISIPFVLSNGSSYWPLQEEIIIWRMIQQLLYTKKLIGQNIMSFDIPVLFAHGFNPFKIYANVVFDTMLAMRCYEPQLPAGLDFLTVAYTREPYYKDEGKEWKNENEDQFWIYGCKDVLVLQEIYPQLKKDLIDDKKLDFYYEWYHKLAKYQLQMTVRGMKVDLEKRRDLERQYAQDIVINQAKLIIITGENINVNSSLQMKRLLYETMKLPKVIKHERVTADRDAILKLSVKHKSEIFDYIMKVRELRKLYSTNIKAPLDSDGRYRSMFGFTETGRFTSSKWPMGTGGNSQNVTKKMRVMFVPDDGFIFLGCDGSQAEARVVAWYANEERLKQIFSGGGDVHSHVASIIFKKPIDQIDHNSERYLAKRIVHASNYGMGPVKFAMSYNMDIARFNLDLEPMDVTTARTLQDEYYGSFPRIKDGYQKRIMEQVMRTKSLENPFGRRIRFHDRLGDELYREAFAFFAQSTVADFTNEILKRVSDDLILVNQEHDGLLFMVREDEVEEAIAFIKKNADIKIFDDLVIPLEFKVGRNWCDMEEIKDLRDLKEIEEIKNVRESRCAN